MFFLYQGALFKKVGIKGALEFPVYKGKIIPHPKLNNFHDSACNLMTYFFCVQQSITGPNAPQN